MRTESAVAMRPAHQMSTGQTGNDPHRDLLDRLSLIGGFDLSCALRNVGGSTDLLVRVLRQFAQMYRDGQPVLLESDLRSPEQSWRFACHSVFGACVSVGATEIARQAEDVYLEIASSHDAEQIARDRLRLHEALIQLSAALIEVVGSR